jgi:hypothetical protein
MEPQTLDFIEHQCNLCSDPEGDYGRKKLLEKVNQGCHFSRFVMACVNWIDSRILQNGGGGDFVFSADMTRDGVLRAYYSNYKWLEFELLHVHGEPSIDGGSVVGMNPNQTGRWDTC